MRRDGAGYLVHVWGPAVDLHLPGKLEARLPRDRPEIRGWISDLYRVWQRSLVTWQDLQAWTPGSVFQYPLADQADLSGTELAGPVERMFDDLARAGHQLFEHLFDHDGGLREIGDVLAAALYEGGQVIGAIDEDLVVPWSMLYVPQQWNEPLPAGAVDRTAFVGYRNLVEHRFDFGPAVGTGIPLDGQLDAGVYFDARLDEQREQPPRAARTVVQPVIEELTKYGTVHPATSARDIELRLRTDGADDQLIYFCCHCTEADDDRRLTLHVGDRDVISSGDVDSWLRRRRLRNLPLVLVNSCRGGETDHQVGGYLSRVLLERGAGCMIGPTIIIPVRYASRFATELLPHLIETREPVGESMRQLISRHIDQLHNPLGLSYALYNGIDSHFCERSERVADPVAAG
ncbi:hypothetical protein KOI35_31050 [Actinoplanes bogorensis]|uniref:CHAT domain-containing protein n=1 Tax=Paractinoplanes bogorensis TaxID=1610840 RepID=A0ABS5YX49_9ACTN|nr:hypothetical protein [Actinoplanes bogorensis]MBU2667958.1 hypothetical protein [Actinoplanes bogorensis]